MKAQGTLFMDEELEGLTGKDEMNLAEYPISLLSKKPIRGVNTIEYVDGAVSWRITGSAEYGLPLGGDQDVYVAIMESWKESGFKDRKIEIVSIFRLLKRVGMSTSKRDYDRFRVAVKRLAGVTIYAENAFYDSHGKKYDTVMGFHLFDDFRITTARGKGGNVVEAPRGYVRASEVLWASVKRGYLKNLNLHFYAGLSSPCVKRIYRFLDKKRYGAAFFRMNMFQFAKKMGLMAGSTRYYPSHVKKDLTPAFEELKGRGFLKSFRYEASATSGEENVICVFCEEEGREGHEEKALIMDILEFTGAEHSVPYYQKRIRELGINAATAIYHALSSAKAADREEGIKTSRDQYFIGVLKATSSEPQVTHPHNQGTYRLVD